MIRANQAYLNTSWSVHPNRPIHTSQLVYAVINLYHCHKPIAVCCNKSVSLTPDNRCLLSHVYIIDTRQLVCAVSNLHCWHQTTGVCCHKSVSVRLDNGCMLSPICIDQWNQPMAVCYHKLCIIDSRQELYAVINLYQQHQTTAVCCHKLVSLTPDNRYLLSQICISDTNQWLCAFTNLFH